MSRRKIKKSPKSKSLDLEEFFERTNRLVKLLEALEKEISPALEDLDRRLIKVEKQCFPETIKND